MTLTLEDDRSPECDVCGQPMVWAKVIGWICRQCDLA